MNVDEYRIVIVEEDDEFVFRNFRRGVDLWWYRESADLEYYSDSPYVASLLEYITIL